MLITFTQDRILLTGQRVTAGQEVEVSEADGAAFIANRVAMASPKPKKTKEE